MKLSLDVQQQSRLLNAHGMLDAFEAVTPGVEHGPRVVRVPFKLGSVRRLVVKNMAALNASVRLHEDSRMALIREIWPDKPEAKEIIREDDPENFDRFVAEMGKMNAQADEIDLAALPAAVLYDSGQDFPTAALLALDEHGLIDGEAAAGKAAA